MPKATNPLADASKARFSHGVPAIRLFCEMNRIIINWKIISRGIEKMKQAGILMIVPHL
jgi:hypothetical protein